MKLYNTLSRQIELLKPLQPPHVSIYTCGLTVYSQPHIGNWVGYVYWDVLVRTLRAEGYQVERTQNITDVGHLVSDDDAGEDKMEKGARAEGLTAWDVAKKYSTVAEREAYELLGLMRPDHLTPATSCIEAQIAFAQKLERAGYLYKIANEGMYFDTSKLQDYGKLAQLDIAGLQAGARVSVDGKRNTTDFAVWKFSPDGSKRDMEWESPWGTGFPGWHLECSVIAQQTLGDQIDIHTGGIDHIPVHHTNEIAQTEAVTGKQFSQVWLHNNHLKVDGTKISKSLGNGYSLSDITVRGISLDAYKLLVLSKHYRTEGNFTWEILEASNSRLQRWYAMADQLWQLTDGTTAAPTMPNIIESVTEQLADDLNTPEALRYIEVLMDYIETHGICDTNQQQARETFNTIEQLLGLQLIGQDISDEAKSILQARHDARQAQDWQSSDELRQQLQDMGVRVRDTARGQIWSLAR
jgi:cysteinyl-tRNA synthetase